MPSDCSATRTFDVIRCVLSGREKWISIFEPEREPRMLEGLHLFLSYECPHWIQGSCQQQGQQALTALELRFPLLPAPILSDRRLSVLILSDGSCFQYQYSMTDVMADTLSNLRSLTPPPIACVWRSLFARSHNKARFDHIMHDVFRLSNQWIGDIPHERGGSDDRRDSSCTRIEDKGERLLTITTGTDTNLES